MAGGCLRRAPPPPAEGAPALWLPSEQPGLQEGNLPEGVFRGQHGAGTCLSLSHTDRSSLPVGPRLAGLSVPKRPGLLCRTPFLHPCRWPFPAGCWSPPRTPLGTLLCVGHLPAACSGRAWGHLAGSQLGAALGWVRHPGCPPDPRQEPQACRRCPALSLVSSSDGALATSPGSPCCCSELLLWVPDRGLVTRRKCSSTGDTVCGCDRGHFCVLVDGDDCGDCRPHSDCRPGQRVQENGEPHTL